MKLPQITWLKAFEAAARHGSFTAAADELALTPAAVSQQIRLLERFVGAQLFTRLPRGVVLTDVGQAYAQPIQRSFTDMRAATEGLFGAEVRRTVRVRASISYAALVLAPKLAEFRARHPEIEVQLSTAVWADRLDDEGVDVDIRYGTGGWEDGTVWHLGVQEACVVCHPDYAASFGDDLSLAALYAGPVVQIIGSEIEWARLAAHLGHPLAPPGNWMKADSSLIALQVVLGGTGAAIVMEAFARPLVAQGLLVDPVGVRLPTEQSFHMVLAEKAARREEVSAFCQWLAGA
jgi:LysR family glycine cleavage system transcriptional activator